jgi:acyl-CoA dehydrogenase
MSGRASFRLPEHVSLTSAGMTAFFTDAHRELAARLKGVAAALGQDRAPKAASVAAALGREHDLYRHLVPEAGSQNLDVRSLVLIREALGYASPLADAIFAVQGLGTYPIAVAGSDEQRAGLDAFVEGKRIAGFGLTEPEAGSDVASLRTEAVREGDAWVLHGEKTLISNVPIADVYVVFANAAPEKGRKGITAFIVPKEAAGLTLVPQPMSIDHPIGMLRMQGCKLPATALLGEVGGGFRLAMQTLETFRISVGAAACGMATAALEDTIVHVGRRVQFDKRLAEQQMVQAYVADMATELDASRLLVARAAHTKDEKGGRPSREVAMAKMYATEAAQRIIDKAVQLHGGRGVLSETRVEALYREIRPLRIYEGTTEIQKLIIARTLLGK